MIMITIIIICDPAWENKAYVHIKFDQFFEIYNYNFVPTPSLSKHRKLASTAHIGKCNAIYRTCTACTEGEISGTM